MDKIMHLRGVKGYDITGTPKFSHEMRGVTVVGDFVWNEDEDRQDIVFAWSIQDPRDSYCKKTGIQKALERMNNGTVVQCDYVERFPLKYQLFNAVAAAREFYHQKEEKNNKTKRFLDLSFYSLAEIADMNGWYVDIESTRLPSVHPDILVNYIHRMNRRQVKACNAYDLLGQYPALTRLVNMTYGV